MSGSGAAAGTGGVGDDAGPDSSATDAGPDAPGCTPDVPCQPTSNYCRTGAVSCTTGTARCVETGNQPNGTLCGTNAQCMNGLCNNDCVVRACTPTNPCHTGTFNCVTGAPMCHDDGTPLADGTRCANDKVCLSGNCVMCSDGGAGCSNP